MKQNYLHPPHHLSMEDGLLRSGAKPGAASEVLLLIALFLLASGVILSFFAK
jgi:hypothetical protein